MAGTTNDPRLPPRRAALYLRVSTVEQADHGLSLGVQEAALRDAAPRHGLRVADCYTDAAVSGSMPISLRPAGARLLADVMAGAVDVVMAVRLDRLFRDTVDALTTDRVWREHGCALLLLDLGGQSLDTSTPMGQMMLTMGASFAQFERQVITERIRAVKSSQHARGIYNSRQPPLGYRKVPGQIDGRAATCYEPDPATEALALEIFHRAGLGQTITEIARALTERGVPSPTGQAWQPSTIQSIIGAPVYQGLAAGRRRTTGPVAEAVNVVPLVPADVWQAAQAALRAGERLTARQRTAHPLSGLLRCGSCGSALYITSSRAPGGGLRHYYRCRESRFHGRCSEPSMRADDIMAAVLPALLALLDPREVRARGKAEARAAAARRTAIADLDRQMSRLTDAYTHRDSTMPVEEYSRLSAEIRTQRERLTDADAAGPAIPPGMTRPEVEAGLRAGDPATWRAMLRAVVRAIVIANREVREITWR